MKKLNVLFILIVILPVMVLGQTMIIEKTDGTTDVISLDDIDNISFSTDGSGDGDGDGDGDGTTVTGKWTNYFDLAGSNYVAYTELVQSGTNLTGTFVFNDGSGYQNILTTSYIQGDHVRIYWMVGTYQVYFDGTMSSDFKTMTGSFYLVGTGKVGDWSASFTGTGKQAQPMQQDSANTMENMLKNALDQMQ